MSIAIESPRIVDTRQRIVLRGISWQTYEALAEELGDQHVRMIYDQGELILLSPATPHERYKMLLGRIVDYTLVGLRIPFEAAGEARWRREAVRRGLEADESFFLTPEKLAIVGGRPAERPDDPLPDLTIEIDVSDLKADRSSIHAALGIPEIWRFDGERLRIGRLLADGTYEDREESQFFPLRAEEAADWVHRGDGVDFLTWIEALQAWIREELAPRRRANGR